MKVDPPEWKDIQKGVANLHVNKADPAMEWVGPQIVANSPSSIRSPSEEASPWETSVP